MGSAFKFDEVVTRLRESPGNITCAELKRMLEDLQFKVIRGTKGNHHRYTHPVLKSFHGGKFDCGHKSTLKPFYPRDVLNTLLDLEEDLRQAGVIQ